MLFSLRWLLEYCPVEVDAASAAEALTARGLTVDAVEPRGEDHAFDVDVPANRPDCLGHLGLARELAAALAPGHEPALFEVPYPVPRRGDRPAAGDSVEAVTSITVEQPSLCPRYTARIVRGVAVGPSPDRIVERLETCGLRSVSNVVDASNLVLLALGHPIHFFDLAALDPADGDPRPAIVVRTPRDGETTLTTLDGEPRPLEPDTLVIADGRRPVALAGVMGGRETEIGERTRDVLIEAAAFDAGSIRRTSRRLGLQTDASFRFARGVDAGGLPAAQAMAVELLVELAGGTPAPGMLDVRAPEPDRSTIRVDGEAVERLLGYRPEAAELRGSLEALGLAPEDDDGRLRIHVPSFRTDLEREADVVEEVARHLGYDRIPARAPASEGGGRPAARAVEERARDLLAGSGFHEAFSYAMIAGGEDDAFVDAASPAPLVLDNPIAETMGVLRRSVLPGLRRAAALNQRRGVRDVRLFEIGHVFLARPDETLPHEPRRIGLAWSGAGEPRHWSRPAREVDLYDLIGLVERTLDALAPDLGTRRERGVGSPAFHPGRSLTWRDAATGRTLARAGLLHPAHADDLEQPLAMAEIEVDPLVASGGTVAAHSGLARLPTASRDLSIVMPVEMEFARVLEVLSAERAPAPVGFEVIDRYEGAPLADGRVSLTIRLTLAPREKTLVDEETDGYRLALIAALRRELDVEIRG